MSSRSGSDPEPTIPNPEESAREAGLRYVSDDLPGITRKKKGKGFSYVGPDGKTVKDPKTLGRIKSLAIPPAWTDVWICPVPAGHLQATGRDDKGRKQYRYHPHYREVREENKYGRMLAFAEVLPQIRDRTRRDLARPGLPREKVLAAVVKLLEKTLIRIGNEEYAKKNNHFGLTTIRDEHVRVRGKTIHFEFKGKSGAEREIDLVADPRLATIVKQCQDLPGEELFQYVDADGVRQDVKSEHVNDYLREITGQDFTAKDFRTWAGTLLAAAALQEFERFDTQAQAKKNVIRAVEAVAKRLGNTRAVCRKCYVHPEIFHSYMDGSLAEILRTQTEKRLRQRLGRMKPEEAAVLALLRQRLAASSGKNGAPAHKHV